MKYFTRAYWTTPRDDTLGLTRRRELAFTLAVASPVICIIMVVGAITALAIKFHGG